MKDEEKTADGAASASLDESSLEEAARRRERIGARIDEEDRLRLGSRALFLFDVAGLVFAIRAEAVLSVHEPKVPSPVPGCPGHVKGLVSQSGRIYPLLDLPGFLGLKTAAEPIDEGLGKRMLLVAEGDLEAAVLCDRAHGLRETPESELWPADVLREGSVQRFLSHELDHDGVRVGVLDLSRLLEAARV